MKILKYIPHALALILAVAFGLTMFNYWTLKKDAAGYREQMLKYSKMYVTADGLASQYATEANKLRAENSALNAAVKAGKETIQNLTQLTGTLKDSLANATTTNDTIYTEDSTFVPIRRFNVTKGNFDLKGYFQITIPYEISFEEMKARINLEIAMSQNKKLIWKSYVSSPDPSFDVSEIRTSVKPYEPSFWEKLKFGVGAYYGTNNRIGMSGSITYSNHSLRAMLDTQGAAVGYEYQFGVRK